MTATPTASRAPVSLSSVTAGAGAPPRRPEARRAPGFYSCSRASTSVEFGVLLPLYLAPVVAGIMLGVALLARFQLDEAALVAMRAVQTGNATTQAQLRTAICGAIGGLLDCNSVMINMNSYASLGSMQTGTPTLTYNANGGVSNSWSMNFGGSGSIMVLQLMYQLPVVNGPLANFASQGNGDLLIASTQVFIKE